MLDSMQTIHHINSSINTLSEKRQDLWRARSQAIETGYPLPIGYDPIYVKQLEGIEKELKDLFFQKKVALSRAALYIL